MKPIYIFFMILVTTSIIMTLGGIIVDNNWSITGYVFDILNGNNFVGSELWTVLLAAVAAVVGITTVATLTGGSSSLGISLAKNGLFAAFLPTFVGDYLSIIKYFRIDADLIATASQLDIVTYYIVLILGGLMLIGFIISLFSFIFED